MGHSFGFDLSLAMLFSVLSVLRSSFQYNDQLAYNCPFVCMFPCKFCPVLEVISHTRSPTHSLAHPLTYIPFLSLLSLCVFGYLSVRMSLSECIWLLLIVCVHACLCGGVCLSISLHLSLFLYRMSVCLCLCV